MPAIRIYINCQIVYNRVAEDNLVFFLAKMDISDKEIQQWIILIVAKLAFSETESRFGK